MSAQNFAFVKSNTVHLKVTDPNGFGVVRTPLTVAEAKDLLADLEYAIRFVEGN